MPRDMNIYFRGFSTEGKKKKKFEKRWYSNCRCHRPLSFALLAVLLTSVLQFSFCLMLTHACFRPPSACFVGNVAVISKVLFC